MHSKAVPATDVLILNSTIAHNIVSALCNIHMFVIHVRSSTFCPFEHHLTGEELFLRSEERKDLF